MRFYATGSAVSCVAIAAMLAAAPAGAQSGSTPTGNNNAAALPPSSTPLGADASEANKPAIATPVIDAEAPAGPSDEIVVTGTAIRGVAPIGSNLVTVGQEAIEKTAAINVSQLVNTVPSISTSGSVAQGENGFSYYSPQIHSLAGSSSNTTLVVLDGLRLPGGGTQFAQTDPNIIPTSAIQRVEVLADGASSVYGSDAVAGVVNFITRRTFDGLEANVRYGFADKYHNTDANFIWGKKWDTGGVYIAGQYNDQSLLRARDRDFTSRGDYRPQGGSNTNSYQCNPATIIVTQPATPGVFLSPGATTTVANTANNAPCNNSTYATLLPRQFRANTLVKVVNDFSDRLTVTATFNYNYQKTRSPNAPGGLTNATAFGNAASTIANPNSIPAGQLATRGQLGQVNPFFTAPAGAPGAQTETVSWLALRPDGNYGRQESEADSVYFTAVADYKLSEKWTATLSDAVGRNRSALNTVNGFCAPCALLALNGTTQVSGNPFVTDIAGQNVVARSVGPLTTANALDVWNPAASTRTSAATQRSLYGFNSENTNYNTFNQVRLNLQGELFDVPAGALKVALGGEYFWQEQTQKISGSNNTGPSTTGSNFRVYNYNRDIKSAYGELYIPVISPEMNLPLLYKVDASISGRYDKFSDVGDTFNPKFAANWEIVRGLKVRGNYSRAFVAPPIAVIGDPTQGFLYASGSIGTQGGINIPTATYPQITQLPAGIAVAQNTSNACTTAVAVCTVGGGTVVGLRRQLGGGFTNEVPQLGRSYSFGVDLAPRFLPGFVASATFFRNKFIGGVSSPSPTAIVNSAGLRSLLQVCTTGCTQAQIDTFANIANGATISGAVPPTVYFLLDQSSRNALNLTVEGIDFQATYRGRVGDLGTFTIGTSGTNFTRFDQNFGGGTSFSILNTSGYNTTFPSVKLRTRQQIGWEYAGISADLFWNYTGSYRNWSSTSINPITTDANGNPTGGGDRIRSNSIFDVHLQYEFQQEGFLKGWQVYVDAQNVFNTKPPFYNGSTGGITTGTQGTWGYNGFVSNPVLRLISVGFRAKL